MEETIICLHAYQNRINNISSLIENVDSLNKHLKGEPP